MMRFVNWLCTPNRSSNNNINSRSRITKRQPRTRSPLVVVLEEYLSNSTLCGCRYLVDPRSTPLEKAMWTVVLALAVTGVVYISKQIWSEFVDRPTFVSLVTNQHPIGDVTFPGVALCNANRISRRRIEEMVVKISNETGASKEDLKRAFIELGRSKEMLAADRRNSYDDLHAFTANLNPSKLMKQLAPDCDEMLLRCSWMEKERPCSEMFKLRRTMQGYCCTFNYIRSQDTMDIKEMNATDYEFSTLPLPTVLMGLTVVATPMVSDYYYSNRNVEGFNVLLFNSRDYPDISSGNLIERFVAVNTINFLDLHAVVIKSTPDVQRFPIRQRECMFADDRKKKYNGFYSYSNCIVTCKMRAIERRCGCIPYYLPTRLNETRLCKLIHVPCLRGLQESLRSVFSADFAKVLEDEPDTIPSSIKLDYYNSLQCNSCYPDCSVTNFKVRFSQTPISNKFKQAQMLLSEDVTDNIIINIYFSQMDNSLYRLDVLYYWFEIVSNFGGIASLFLGCSLISVVEFIYFFTFRLYAVLRYGQRHQ